MVAFVKKTNFEVGWRETIESINLNNNVQMERVPEPAHIKHVASQPSLMPLGCITACTSLNNTDFVPF